MEDKTIYLDNAATSHPRPQEVREAINDYLARLGASPGRSGHSSSLKAGRLLLETRELAADFFGGEGPENVIFTQNVTHAINAVLKGYISSDDHVITTRFEHNSVLRPLEKLQKTRNITVDYLSVDVDGSIREQELDNLKRKDTSLVIINHASNVSGAILDIATVDNWCRKNSVPLLVDTAQSAGSIDFDWHKIDPDFLCFTGHKGLMGPAGMGGFIISSNLVEKTDSFVQGGTGSKSDQLSQPQVLPDKYEAGTINTVGIAGLNAAFKFLAEQGTQAIKKHKMNLTSRFYQGLSNLQGINIVGPGLDSARTSTISLTFAGADSAEIALKLDRKYDIMTRSGLHCAPLAHRELGTYPTGALRFSIGYFNTKHDIDETLKALQEVMTS